jgi:hypothetical protein
MHLVNGTHDAHGVLRCQTAAPECRLTFMVDSTDAAATLADFGFAPDLAASAASLNGDVEWHPTAEQPWLASLQGTLSMRLADGTLRPVLHKEGDVQIGDVHIDRGNTDVREASAGPVAALADVGGGFVGGPAERRQIEGRHAEGTDVWGAEVRGVDFAAAGAVAATDTGAGAGAGTDVEAEVAAFSDDAARHPFALLAVPALVSGLDAPGAAGSSLTKEQQPLHFAHLEADFELHDGQATTSNLHFDGDAEILMRGRIGLVSRDYDQQVWLLRGEERLPAAVRRFGATPRVAAAWLSLRDLFGGSGAQDRSRAVLRLQGSWDDPMVVTAN